MGDVMDGGNREDSMWKKKAELAFLVKGEL